MDKSRNYPIVFVHGMFGWGENEGINKIIPYWGATTGNITDKLKNEGYACYSASVGPVASAWDASCELYAQLTGTRVDYGAAHSKKHGHSRFGRKYEKPLFANWDENKKIHLIGHSFGGNVARLFVHLLTCGDKDEIAESENDTSPLFLGGKENLVCSVSAICTPLNGTSAHEIAKRIKLLPLFKCFVYTYAGALGRSCLNGKLVDFHLEQFGLTDAMGMESRMPLKSALKKVMKTRDNIEYDMSASGAEELNEKIKLSSAVFYFSYSFSAVKRYANGKVCIPSNTDFFFLFMTSALMMKNAAYNEKKSNVSAVFDNDGLVDLDSALYPKKELHRKFDGTPIRGIWNVMPTLKGDHGTPIGLFADKKRTAEFYLNITKILDDIL